MNYYLDLSDKLEIGSKAHWSVSSCKPGFGVEQLRDGSLETYWQSDGALPHFVNIQFTKRINLTFLYFYVNYGQDESYTPHVVRLRVGSNFHDLQDIASITLEQPQGWQEIDISRIHLDDDIKDPSYIDEDHSVWAHYVQLCIDSNQQLGKDCHIRQIKIFSERPRLLNNEPGDIPSMSPEFELYTFIR